MFQTWNDSLGQRICFRNVLNLERQFETFLVNNSRFTPFLLCIPRELTDHARARSAMQEKKVSNLFGELVLWLCELSGLESLWN